MLQPAAMPGKHTLHALMGEAIQKANQRDIKMLAYLCVGLLATYGSSRSHFAVQGDGGTGKIIEDKFCLCG